eukprot:354290-Chlamydomonas_euryale.AAC.2
MDGAGQGASAHCARADGWGGARGLCTLRTSRWMGRGKGSLHTAHEQMDGACRSHNPHARFAPNITARMVCTAGGRPGWTT